MGRMQADEFAGLVARGEVSLELALGWHLQHNHFPPVPSVLIEVCKQAIEAAQADEGRRAVSLPAGVTFRGQTSVQAWQVIEGLHLESFVEGGGDVR